MIFVESTVDGVGFGRGTKNIVCLLYLAGTSPLIINLLDLQPTAITAIAIKRGNLHIPKILITQKWGQSQGLSSFKLLYYSYFLAIKYAYQPQSSQSAAPPQPLW